jgi:hypothetical protein
MMKLGLEAPLLLTHRNPVPILPDEKIISYRVHPLRRT